MKLLLVLLVFLLAAWLWRTRRHKNTDTPKPPPQKSPQDMVSCARCGLHIPQAESVQGRDGVYCCQAHHVQTER
jgi:uncharacterized protein